MVASLLIDGQTVHPTRTDDGWFWYRVMLPAGEMRLISGAARPADFGGSGDRRRLGVQLYSMLWQQGRATMGVPIESTAFMDGFEHPETAEDTGLVFRWTNGDAALPPSLTPSWQGEAVLGLVLKPWRGTAITVPLHQEFAVLNAFESLGDTCELALAQRHFGVELPMGLLRWSGSSYDNLLRGLECRFAGVGDPETTDVLWYANEYRLDTPYFRMHTMIIDRKDAAGVAEIAHHGCITLRLMRRKLLRDIADARRIFVFRCANPELGHREMRRLHAALRAIGPASLLWVTLKSPHQPRDVIERLDDGLYVGYLDSFAGPDGPFDAWASLCARVLAMHRAFQP